MKHQASEQQIPRVIAWESTRACNLVCKHCRADAQIDPDPEELTTAEVKTMIDQIAAFSKPIFIISGGEPLMRKDIFEIADYANQQGLRVAMSPNGTLIDPQNIQKMKGAGIKRISVSLDGSCAQKHDAIRGVRGAFDDAVRGMKYCLDAKLPFQINTTVMRENRDDLKATLAKVIELGAVAWHVFMLVPTGRGRFDDEITPQEYEDILNWVYETSQISSIPIRVTCGPQFMRIVSTKQKERKAELNLVGQQKPKGHPGGHPGLDHTSRGCLAGVGYCFISHRGEVFPCGYLPVLAGDVRKQDFQSIYQNSDVFIKLRNYRELEGKCGVCPYIRQCGGCRARAYALTGNYLAEEPFCVYDPPARRGA